MTVIPSQFDTLAKLVDSSQLRHRVISQNVANVNTPGYRTQEVSFEEMLAARLRADQSADVSDLKPSVQLVEGLPERADGNNVDIDKQMGQLDKNALLYQAYVQILASKLATMQSAITGQ